jgi:hypothetical protein
MQKITIKQKFRISRKWKLPFSHLFRRKTPFHFRFHFRQKISISVPVPQISVSVFTFSFRFRFSTENSESFRSTFIPIWGCHCGALMPFISVALSSSGNFRSCPENLLALA